MKKKILISSIIFLLCLALGSYFKVQAGESENVRGWLWGGGTEPDGSGPPWDGTHTNVGWISMNNTNCDTDDNLTIDDAKCISEGATGTLSRYGVDIPTGVGNVLGYAWSANIGWVDFDTLQNCTTTSSPPSGQYQAASCSPPGGGAAGVYYDGTGQLSGWARIVGIAQESVDGNAGGWEGWISMSGSNYGVTVADDGSFCRESDATTYVYDGDGDGTDENHCFAWSNELGWIDFGGDEGEPSVSTINVDLQGDKSIVVVGDDTKDDVVLTATVTGSAPMPYDFDFDCGDGSGQVYSDINNTTQQHTCLNMVISDDVIATVTVSAADNNSDSDDWSIRYGCIYQACDSSSAYKCTNRMGDPNICNTKDQDCDANPANPATCYPPPGWREVVP